MCSGEVNVVFGKASQSQGLCGSTHYSVLGYHMLSSYCPGLAIFVLRFFLYVQDGRVKIQQDSIIFHQ